MFGMDPVAVLDEKVTLHTQIRHAALRIWEADQVAMLTPKDPDG